MRRRVWLTALVAAAALAGAFVWWLTRAGSEAAEEQTVAATSGRIASVAPVAAPSSEPPPLSAAAAAAPSDAAQQAFVEATNAVAAAASAGADAEDREVDAFYALTDLYLKPRVGKGVTSAEAEAFHSAFAGLPARRKRECLQRALNLVPDENSLLLAGILMDGAEDPELVRLVFNDVLNRDDAVKGALLKEIFKDRKHPCWADTAWVLDVTGQLPTAKETRK